MAQSKSDCAAQQQNFLGRADSTGPVLPLRSK
jgi:hypothetical protein